MLAKRVEAGELPPLAERIPMNPLVVDPVEEIGRYGGNLTSAILGPAEAIQMFRVVGYEGLVRWTPDWDLAVIPNIAESFEVSPDDREFTFRLREGMKWSDGEPFTADDLVFARNDVLNNDELYPSGAGNPVRAEKIDDYTVTFIFDDPEGLFLPNQARVHSSNAGTTLVSLPKHVLEQYHADFNPDIDELVDAEGAADWVQLFLDKTDIWSNSDLPTLNPWIIIDPVGEGNQVRLERNPYYFKTDPEGNQLPYIDRVTYDIIQDDEVILLRVVSGDIDLQLRPVNSLENRPILAADRESGGFRFFDAIPANMNTMALCLNLSHKDEAVREVFRNKDFRIGLSHAINREEIITAVYQRQGEPWQCAPRPESPLFDEKLAKQYTEYDVDLANEYLDSVLPEKDGSGYRLLPNGDRLRILIEFATGIWPDYPGTLNLIEGYWKAVGVDTSVNGMDRSLFLERTEAGDHDAAVWQGSGGLNDIYLNPRFYAPTGAGNAAYAFTWTEWYTSGGESGEEPPEPVRRQFELYDQVKATTDADEQATAMTEILQIAKEEFWVMGINLQPEEYGVVSAALRNVPDAMPNAWDYPTPAPTNPEQYFFDGE
ncbi:ABC transporter substrate-binding protein [Phytoactinopolyspora mesophila]|uniref:ABC transporter substrate-binding protein n=1 Tax=Phytoactinopolyspora mesophila TaxID=2650750 RepID=A0A7K3M970_9ACTN|nr:ABC transporter substrate-binding protein [Phytoactinopolyspora mesophila]NDL59740.1 ABC transporter substrate-binding protein [Phytoactinopolyspora mesophila]